MKTRLVIVIALAIVGLLAAIPADAGWFSSVFQFAARETKRRNCWPQPFVCPDRHDARAPFVTMVNNGWRRQNLLGEHHFVDGKDQLTEAGRLKVRWILTEAPHQHRAIYVHEALHPETTTARVYGVQQFALQFAVSGQVPMVLTTDIPSYGWPASQVDAIGRAYENTMPEPRLPESQSGGGGE